MESEIITAYVGIGSNLGNRAGNLLLAVRGLTEANFIIHRLSAVYETEPVDVSNDQPNYLNMVAEIHLSNISPSQMMARMLRIEYLLGRRRIEPKAPRTVDLDLLIYGNQIVETDFLTIPHPRMHFRNFVLVPFNEIAPQVLHPVLNLTVQELFDNSTDVSIVERWKPLIEESNVISEKN